MTMYVYIKSSHYILYIYYNFICQPDLNKANKKILLREEP